MSSLTLNYAARIIRRHLRAIGSRWRKLSPGNRPMLLLAYLRKARRSPSSGWHGRRVVAPHVAHSPDCNEVTILQARPLLDIPASPAQGSQSRRTAALRGRIRGGQEGGGCGQAPRDHGLRTADRGMVGLCRSHKRTNCATDRIRGILLPPIAARSARGNRKSENSRPGINPGRAIKSCRS